MANRFQGVLVKSTVLVLGFLFALIIAFIVSIATMFLSFVILSVDYGVGIPFTAAALTGFMGVCIGAFVLPRSWRWLASILLLIAGLTYYCHMAGITDEGGPHAQNYPLLLPLLCGGSVAVIMHTIWSYLSFMSRSPRLDLKRP